MNDKLTSQDKQEIQKLMQNTDDAEAIAAVVKAKANKDKNMNEEVEDELEQYEYIKSKRVQDADGFYTDYTMYFDHDNNRFVFIFGDSDLYTPEDEDFDWECDTVEEAEEWFDNYNGFEDEEIDFEVDESLNESIDISTYTELPSGISDGGINYELFRKVENGKGKWAAWETHFGERVGEPFEITYEQAIGETPINQSGVMSRYLGKKLLPKNNYLDEDTNGSFKYDVYIYGAMPTSSHVIATFDTEEEAEAYCNENDWHFIDPETTFDWGMDYRESWYGNTNESFYDSRELNDYKIEFVDDNDKEDYDVYSAFSPEYAVRKLKSDYDVKYIERVYVDTGRAWEEVDVDLYESLNEAVEDFDLKNLSDKDKYMFLSRMQSDCKYCISNNSIRHLWGKDVDSHIESMKYLYSSLKEKPEWISMDDINEYEVKLKRIESEKKKSMNEGTSYKRISRFNEPDNGHILHNWKKMSNDEAEEEAKQASIKDANDVYYVAYDDIMNPSSDEYWYQGKSYTNKEIMDLLKSKKDKQLKEDLDTISYNDYIANSFDGYSDDIDDELRILNQYARALHTVAKNIYCVQITGDDIYDITPEYTDVEPVKPINQFGTLYNVDGIDVVQDNVDAYRTDLWFKNEQLANEFISTINE